MNLTRGGTGKKNLEPFIPEMLRLKYYPVDHEEELAIRQAEACISAIAERMSGVGEKENARIMHKSLLVLSRMREGLEEMGATKTTMGYN